MCVPLPEAFRSLPRPSSPRDAKASIVCPYTLGRRVFLSSIISFTLQFLFPRLCNFQRSNAWLTRVRSAKITGALFSQPQSGCDRRVKLRPARFLTSCCNHCVVAIMVGVPGIEPGTSTLSGLRSNQLSYTPKLRG